ncbi:hypothetical protein [Escherichia coli]|uniref:hypothetical protein n=1 Tax=Escherichia coli TaxID=562 RepID=UPI00066EF848|nr:hypothetical protein [Escherichia coli]KMV60452.1 hypothetical protein ACM21_04875 [Escherichia coli]
MKYIHSIIKDWGYSHNYHDAVLNHFPNQGMYIFASGELSFMYDYFHHRWTERTHTEEITRKLLTEFTEEMIFQECTLYDAELVQKVQREILKHHKGQITYIWIPNEKPKNHIQ